MNNHQRGIYQPLAENVPLYDAAGEGPETEDEEGRSRLPLMIVISLVVLAAFTGVVWLAYNQGVSRGRAGNTVVINAPEGPVRVAPGDGGGGTSFTGLKIYNQPVPPDQEAQASSLAPAAPEPSSLAVPAPTPAPRPSTTEAPQVRLDPGPPVAPPVKPAVQMAAVQAPPPPKPAPAAAPVPAPVPPPAPQPAIAQAPRPAPAPSAAPNSSIALSGAAVLQIGSYESAVLANNAWTTFKTRHVDVAGELSGDVQQADLGARGIWYRLRIGPFKDRPSAVAACEKLRTQGTNCLVTAP